MFDKQVELHHTDLKIREAGDPNFKQNFDRPKSGLKFAAAFAQDGELGVITLVCGANTLIYHFSNHRQETDRILNPFRLWHTESAYPLICISNRFMTKQVYIYHTLEKDLTGKEDQAGLIKFNLPGKHLIVGTEIRSD